MPAFPDQHDIHVFNLVHQLLNQDKKAGQDGVERRRRSRRPFSALHRVRPVRGGSAPSLGDFVVVRCRDLNEAGFAFLWPHRPDFRQLVVAFGSGPEEIQMLASVAHWHEVFAWPSGTVEPIPRSRRQRVTAGPGAGGPQAMFQVGCRFLRRLTPG